METSAKFETLQPRHLHYRSHYKIYLVVLLTIAGLILSWWGFRLSGQKWATLYAENSAEIWLSFAYYVGFTAFYFLWLRWRLNRSVQVFPDHLLLHHDGKSEKVDFADIESCGVVCWSVFYFKTKNGLKHYFSASLERVDYVWEGFYAARPDLINKEEYENFRMKLVQYDHHQKRKEWFFKHKMVDLFNWTVLPSVFLFTTYFIQTREIIVHQQVMYFFRLGMYAFLILLMTTLIFSMFFKKFVFDKKIADQMDNGDKIRDIEFEGVVLHRSKLMQMVTISFIFGLVMRSEANMFSITKTKGDLSAFNIKSGQTLVVDNRYNCLACKYSLKDGDVVIFGRGTVGQIMAAEGDMVGQISQDKTGRIIASENIQEVPTGHVAVKLSNQKEIVMIKVQELIGKVQK